LHTVEIDGAVEDAHDDEDLMDMRQLSLEPAPAGVSGPAGSL